MLHVKATNPFPRGINEESKKGRDGFTDLINSTFKSVPFFKKTFHFNEDDSLITNIILDLIRYVFISS